MSKSFRGVVSCNSAAPASRVARQADRPSPAGAAGLWRVGVVGLRMPRPTRADVATQHGRPGGRLTPPVSAGALPGIRRAVRRHATGRVNMPSFVRLLVAAIAGALIMLTPAAAAGPAPGGPGTDDGYLPADKSG